MQTEPYPADGIPHDEWLEAQCRQIDAAGHALAAAVGPVNERARHGPPGEPGRRPRVTEAQLRETEEAWKALHDAQVAVQNALFDCEHEMRALREREISPVELLVDGDRLIIQYRFLRRRARILDGLLAFLPAVSAHAHGCLERLQKLREGGTLEGRLLAPDCGFALVALEQLREEEGLTR
jgi:hypothetical protein